MRSIFSEKHRASACLVNGLCFGTDGLPLYYLHPGYAVIQASEVTA